MKIEEWCQLHDITKSSYYWKLRKVHEAYLKKCVYADTVTMDKSDGRNRYHIKIRTIWLYLEKQQRNGEVKKE